MNKRIIETETKITITKKTNVRNNVIIPKADDGGSGGQPVKWSSVGGAIREKNKKAYICKFNGIISKIPRLLSSRAVSLPIPVLAPVMTAILPSSRLRLVQRGPWNQRGIIARNLKAN